MGPSGSGKSTLLHLVAGLDWVTAGEILLDGRSCLAFGDREWTQWRREKIGMVFQAFHLIPGLTIEENVALPLRLRGGFFGLCASGGGGHVRESRHESSAWTSFS